MSKTSVVRSTQTTTRPVSVRIVEAVAEREASNPLDLDPVLNDVVDPDALDALFAENQRPAEVTFAYHGYRVVVDETGEIELTDPDQA